MKQWEYNSVSCVLNMIKRSYSENGFLLECWRYYLKNMNRKMFIYMRELDADFFKKIGF